MQNVIGLISAGDEHTDEVLAGLENDTKIVEDILIYDEDLPTHVKRVREVIGRCASNGITLNRKKFIFAVPEFSIIVVLWSLSMDTVFAVV